MNKTIKVPWEEFKKLALDQLKETHPFLIEGEATFMKLQHYEPDSRSYDLPDYVEIPLN